jgi:AcrR family transcriptional regulator
MGLRRLTREESAAQTRRRLLEAAESLFVERGFHSASLEAVADRAGFSKGAVYSRFDSKADLFLALLDERNPRTVQAFAKLVAEAQSAAELVGSFGRWWAERLGEAPAWSLVLIEFWTSAGRDRALRDRFAESHERLMSALADLIDDAVERLGVQLAVPSLDLARVTTALGRGLELERLVNPEAFDEALTAWAFNSFAGPDTGFAEPMSISPEGT